MTYDDHLSSVSDFLFIYLFFFFKAHRAQLHTLLAVYAMSMNNSEAAEIQFNAALRVR